MSLPTAITDIHPDAKAAASNLHDDLHDGTGQVAENVLRVVEELDGEVTRQELKDTRARVRHAYRCRSHASARTSSASVKDTIGALSLNHVRYGLATRGAFEAWRCP